MATKLQDNGIVFPDGSVQTSSAYDTFKNAQTFTASGTWTCPANVYIIQLTLFGGGGNGRTGTTFNSGGSTFYTGGGGGGSSAVIWNYRVAVVPTTAYTVTVGAGTIASSFGALATANPGNSAINSNGASGGSAFNVGTIITLTDRTTAPQSVAGNAGSGGSQSQSNGNATGGAGGTTPIFNNVGGAPNGGNAAANSGAGGAGALYNATPATAGLGGSGLVIVQW